MDKVGVTLEEGESYEFRNVVSSIWQDQVSLKANSSSEIILLEMDIKVRKQSVTVRLHQRDIGGFRPHKKMP